MRKVLVLICIFTSSAATWGIEKQSWMRKEVVFTIAEVKLKSETKINPEENDENHAGWQAFMQNFSPDLSPFAPLIFGCEGPAIAVNGKPAAEIVVAPGELAKSSEELQFWIKEMDGTDGFCLRSHDKNIYLFGANSKGTINNFYSRLGD